MRSLKNIFPFLSLAIALFMFVPQAAFAGSEDNVSGWAWSSNIGWISLNNTNTGSSIDYGVNKNSDGTLTGWGWSSNVGWIKFGGLSSFPSIAGTVSANAQVQSGGAVTGWVRACAGTATGDCATMSSRTDGWGGWIALSGTSADSSSYGISVSQSGSSGYAWGDNVFGWTTFNPSGFSDATPGVDGCTSSTNCGVVITPPTPDFTLTCNKSNVAPSASQIYFDEPIQANPTGGFNNTISVTAGSYSLPSGITYSLMQSSPTINCSTGICPLLDPLTVQFSKALPSNGQSYWININGTYSGDTHSCTINIQAPAVPNTNPLFQEI